MRPIMLSGHERALTQVVYNSEGDLLFTCSKDHVVNVWRSHNGERVGTYDGHNGTVWTVDVDSASSSPFAMQAVRGRVVAETESRQGGPLTQLRLPSATSTFLVTGSADNMMKLWDVKTGECLYTWEFPTAVKRVAWSEDDQRVLAVTEKRMGFPGGVSVFAINRDEPKNQSKEPQFTIKPTGSKATVAAWCGLDEFIVTAHEDGTLNLWDTEEGLLFFDKEERGHTGVITDLQMSPDGTYFVTSSKDKSAKIWSVGPHKNAHGEEEYLTLIKTYTGEPPLNSAAIVPGKPYVVMGGGQEAMNVTTTGARQGHFEVRFFHRIFEEEVSRVKGGFGPCNSIAAHPQGKGYAIGGEDGYVRVHEFDKSWFDARPYGPLEPEVD
ncbi:WD40 repeat-like protein [Rhodotorula diobovata]|uniref:Eukaryotic translation initiation factor 3 subunit I n=1 Tax=Rhodotorula diobovata TaxID=5288 RepID=A0A5C5FUP9_9BASI|nr:WD40 repeat-like protein [Rhodotorula diobovata]